MIRRIVVMSFMLSLITLGVVGLVRHLHGHHRDYLLTSGSTVTPAPWLIPVKADEAVLRLAMVHDVIHERFVRHGPAWYAARQRDAQAALDALGPELADDPRRLALMDDLAVGCDRLGRPQDGIAILRRKLGLQNARLPPERRDKPVIELYTTYANLGTVLIHAAFGPAVSGDATAIKQLGQGRDYIRLAMQANPHAHFGRETWQAEAVESILAAISDPQRMLRYDLIGLPLSDLEGHRLSTAWPGPTYADWMARQGGFDAVSARIAAGDINLAAQVREHIPVILRTTADGNQDTRPFDEPTLGLIGMWTLGGGANPHSAMALGHLMEAVNQRHLAWDAYERACELGERFSPRAEIRERMINHCRQRQLSIAARLGESEVELRTRHQSELAHGLAFRAAYQADEAARLAAGASTTNPALNAAYLAARPRIATQSGNEDAVVTSMPVRFLDYLPLSIAALTTLALIAYALQHLDRRLVAAASRRIN